MALILQDDYFEQNMYVSQETAIRRAACVSQVGYTLTLILAKGPMYMGETEVVFELTEEPEGELVLDYRGYKLGPVVVNGTVITPVYSKHTVVLPRQNLKLGANKITLMILNQYRNDGVGMHSFTDQQDGAQYMYTNLACDACRYVFPCFDQPDLKALLVSRKKSKVMVPSCLYWGSPSFLPS